MISGIQHTGISVKDMKKALAFYRDLLDFEVRFDIEASGEQMETIVGLKGARARIVMLAVGEQSIELFQYMSPEGKPFPSDHRQCDAGLIHLALQVTNLDGLYKDLKDKGVQFYSEPQQLPGAKVVYLRDPGGVTVELIQPTA